jgi:cellulose synthase/poly-beta-1,6-N-acetylglucosamine synthase-like glycosyltransferase
MLALGTVVYLAVCIAALPGQFHTRPLRTEEPPAVSVIVPARNEEANIGCLLDDLVRQDYPPNLLEVVVVDDCSEDGTARIVREAMARDPRIRLETTAGAPSPYLHKKGAIYRGITSSTGEIVMTVDADARIPQTWVSSRARCFAPSIDLAAGDVIVGGGGLMGWIEALELTAIQTVSAGLMNIGLPVTCNGANLAYRRSAFVRVGGFGETGGFVSGDDDMLMQKIASGDPKRVVYCPGPGDAVFTAAVASPGEFINRRTRWTSKILGYPSKSSIAMLVTVFLYLAAILVWCVLALVGVADHRPLMYALALKAGGDLGICIIGVVRFRRPWLLAVFPLAEALHIPYIIMVALRGTFGSFEWRGRQVRAVHREYEQGDQTRG